METKDVLIALRKKHNLTQEQMAERLFVTRQAVSRWETGETTPGVDTLRLISASFDVSVNTLLGAPRKLICQCCGMPLDDESISREPDGSFNEDYCKWCYTDGEICLPRPRLASRFSGQPCAGWKHDRRGSKRLF